MARACPNWWPPLANTKNFSGSRTWYSRRKLKAGASGWWRCCESLLERVLREQMGDGAVARYAAEVAERRRDPYALVEEIVSKVGK